MDPLVQIMKTCKVIHVFLIPALLVSTLDADSDDCMTELHVRRDTIYKASPEQELRIKCPVKFCNNSPPTITWFKIDEKDCVKVNSSRRIKTEWRTLNHQVGISYLVFQNILRSDSGGYMCEGGDSRSHAITVSVNVTDDKTRYMTEAPGNSTSQSGFHHVTYRVFGVVTFFVIVILICVLSKIRCKGKCQKTEEPQNPSQIYEDVL